MAPDTPAPGALVAALHQRLMAAGQQADKARSETAFWSPLSISFALALALNAAGPGSSTHAQLLSLLGGSGVDEVAVNASLSGLMAALHQAAAGAGQQPGGEAGGASSSGDAVVLANSIWARAGTPVRAEYAQAMVRDFQASAREARSTADINAWAAEVTRGLITEAVPPGSPFDLVLANALYFKGSWEAAFDPAATHDAPFTLEDGSVKQVRMMARTFKPRDPAARRPLLLRRPGQFTAVRLPYQGGAFSALAVLPDSREPGALAGLAAGLDLAAGGWASDGTGSWEAPAGELRLLLPKFKARAQVSLAATLQAAGVTAAFDGAQADFGRLSNMRLAVDDVIHTVVVEVDEAGTEAAATTAIMMVRMALPLPPEELALDRPFLFAVLHDASAAPLFVGTVAEPRQEAA